MRIVPTLVLSLAAFLHSIESSLQFDCLPNGEPISCFTQSVPPASTDSQHSPERLNSPDTASSTVEPPVRVRSRSPSVARPSLCIFGFNLEERKFLRLSPKVNPERLFKMERYTLPTDGNLKLRGKYNIYHPVPTGERAVLADGNGDVFAIFEKNNTILRGIYAIRDNSLPRYEKRVKINMNTGTVKEMTPKEIRESSLSWRGSVSKNFGFVDVTSTPHH